VAQPTTHHRIGTRPGPVDRPLARTRRPDPTDSPFRGHVSLAAGALAVVVAILPSLGVVALALAGVAIGTGVPVMRRGPGTAAFPSARVGVVLGMIGVLLGVISLAMQLLA
jgi:hypothetical protein